MTPSSISSKDLKKGSAGHWISFGFVSCCGRLIHLKDVTLRVYHFKQSLVVCYFLKDLTEAQEDSLLQAEKDSRGSLCWAERGSARKTSFSAANSLLGPPS